MIFGFFFRYQYYFGLSKLVKREDGWSYFTGRGCGTISPIKYFDIMPENTEGIECALVRPQSQLLKLSGEIKTPVEGK